MGFLFKFGHHSFHYHYYLYSIVQFLFFLFRYVILTRSLFHFLFSSEGMPVGKHGAARGTRLLAQSHNHYQKCISMDFLLLQWNIRLRHKSVAFSVCAHHGV